MTKSRYKTGDCVLYMNKNGYWKVFKIIGVNDNRCFYNCLDGSFRGAISNKADWFHINSFVGKDGIIIDESDYMSYVVAKIL